MADPTVEELQAEIERLKQAALPENHDGLNTIAAVTTPVAMTEASPKTEHEGITEVVPDGTVVESPSTTSQDVEIADLEAAIAAKNASQPTATDPVKDEKIAALKAELAALEGTEQYQAVP